MFNDHTKKQIAELRKDIKNEGRNIESLYSGVVAINKDFSAHLESQNRRIIDLQNQQKELERKMYRVETLSSARIFLLEAQMKALADFVGAEFEGVPAKPARVRAITKVVEL